MSAKRQSSLMSFFTKTPKQEKPEEAENKVKKVEKPVKKQEAVPEKKVLKRTNSQTASSPVKNPRTTTKRAKVIICSSSEGEDADDDSGDEDFEMKEGVESSEESEVDENASDDCEVTYESTPQNTPKSTPSRAKKLTKRTNDAVNTPKSSKTAKIMGTPHFGKSKKVIGEFDEVPMAAVEEKMAAIMGGDGERRKKNERGGSKEKDDQPRERFDHESFEFLKPEKIKDASKRPASDPEYDPKTLWVPPEFHQKQTPGHRQWWNIKSQHFDTIILFKVGKFYETYHMDAVEVVRALNIAFMRGSFAHAGFPEHAASKFADQLMNHGYKVARVEQTETPQMLEERNQKAKSKDKVVRREVCRVTSNGTRTYGVLDGVDLGSAENTLDPTAKYLLAIKEMHNPETGKSTYGVCMIDTTTAHIRLGQFEDDDYRSHLRTLLANVIVVQTLVERGSMSTSTKSIINGILFSIPIEQLLSKKQFMSADDVVRIVSNDDYYGSDASQWPEALRGMLEDSSVLPKASSQFQLALSAFGAIFWYLRDSLIDVDMLSMRNVSLYSLDAMRTSQTEEKVDWKGKSLILDGTALENLNIVPNGRDSHSTSLYYVINKCSTPFGRRLLRSWLLQPTCDPNKLRLRQETIKWMTSSDATSFVTKATAMLKKIPDLDRLIQKIHTIGLKYRAEKHPDGRAIFFDTLKTNQKKIGELLGAIDGFKLCNKIRKEYLKMQQEGEGCELLDELLGNEQQMEEVDENIVLFETKFDRTSALKEGKIVPNEGHDEEYDQATERVREAIGELNSYKNTISKKYSCSIKFIDSGKLKYLLEMPDSVKVSSAFELKSRRKGFIRYSTADSEDLVASLDVAEKEKSKLGDDATRRVFEQFGHKNPIWVETVKSISNFDVMLSLAIFSKSCPFDMCMPEFDFESSKPYLVVEKGVHPCLALQSSKNEVTKTTSFIANSTTMGENEAAVMLLTGPNMGGKSTLMRQTAVLAILAHLGSMVPAFSMRLTPIDRIFTRIGANDRIMCGESTFFIELKETDIMLKKATKHSLLLVDELGRGTSTFDGTAIASAVLQKISDDLVCRTFFSTHYHSICNSFTSHPNVRLAHMKCVVDKENNDDPTMEDVTFLYELESGICPKSYGFYAAKLAGIDQQVVRNAYAESNKFASNMIIDPKIRQLVECARDENFDVNELRKMIEAM